MEDDIRQALAKASLLDKFLALPPSHQRQYNDWIDSAKKLGTRAARIAKMVEMLKR